MVYNKLNLSSYVHLFELGFGVQDTPVGAITETGELVLILFILLKLVF